MDNRAAEHVLIRGSARPADANLLAHWFWLRCAVQGVRPEVYRVASKSNIADGPSRGDWSGLGPEFVPDTVELPPELGSPSQRSQLEALFSGDA